MTAQDVLQMLREMRDVAFATVDEHGMPEVRITDVMIAENSKIYFCTARGKDFYRQLQNGGRVAIVGLNKDFKSVRLAGKARRLFEQKKWIDRIFEENPQMNGVYPGESRYILEAFCISDAWIEVFDLGKEPINRETFYIGDSPRRETGFHITESCIGCGTCKASCPQQCIEKGEPFSIRQKNCLHCGLCFESCPVQAITKISC